ncbi:oncoprotein-induced transcript 3 protein-like [Pempheris klunzingeri]|uniref:oncoprotein-induced transcript 3 protein-like n=1 Tax=Pempheris klunzingeri TaxID=3127111 RepID=UPI003981227E
MVVAVEKASMPGIDETFLQLRDPSCSLTSNTTHIMGSMSFSTCGTRVEDKGDFIVFKNEINSFELPTEVITRRKKVRIDFSCLFPKTISISSYYDLHSSDYIFTESSFGSFGYSFEIFRDGNFTNKVRASAYPVEVKLLETVFMGIQAQSELPSVKLFVESCKATPDDNPGNTLSYDLIRNGCLEDETLKIHPSNDSSFNFEVQAFKFTGNYDQVYITCSVILCDPGSAFSRCAQGCLKDPSRRRRRGLGARETQGHYITQGPLQFVSGAVPNAAVEDNELVMTTSETTPPVIPFLAPPESRMTRIRELLSTNISTVVFASAFLVSLVVMAVVVHHFVRKRKAEDQNSLLVADWEN